MHRKGLIGYVIRSLVPLLRGKVIKGQLAPPPPPFTFIFPLNTSNKNFETNILSSVVKCFKIVSLRMTAIPPLATPLRVKVLDYEAN